MSRRKTCWPSLAGLVLVMALLAVPAHAQQMRQRFDEAGRRVILPERIERIVSLAPSITEMLFALGVDSRLVGVTQFCDYPPAAKSKTSVGEVINPSLEKIAAVKPDLVLATTAGNRRETVAAIERLGIPLYGLNPRSVEDVLLSIRTLGDLLGVPDAADKLEPGLRNRLAAVAVRLTGRPRPRVLFVLWLEPLMSVGRQTFVHDALARAGAESITATRPEDWPRLNLEEVLRQDPDYLVLTHSPALERRLEMLRRDPAWSSLRALQQNRLITLDEAVLRPGPRIVDAIEQLARALHPEVFLQ